MILETSFLIDLMDEQPDAVKRFWALQQQKTKLCITTPTIFELSSGVARCSKPEQEKMKIAKVLESQMILDLDKESAEKAGEIDGLLIKEGKGIEPEDCMIAGIAKHHQETILTRNLKHFGRIKGISLETY